MVFTECYSIFIQLIHIVDEVRYRAMRFDAVRYSSIEVHGKVKFSEKLRRKVDELRKEEKEKDKKKKTGKKK